MSYEDFGIGVLKVSACMLSEFAEHKPKDLEIVGSEHSYNTNFPVVALIIKGPMIPTIPGLRGIPDVICTVTKLDDGSFEWDFRADPDTFRSPRVEYSPKMCRCVLGETGITQDPARLVQGMKDAVKALGL
jgi:hypothetical protein